MCAVLCQVEWFSLYLVAQEERGFEGAFRDFLDVQVSTAGWLAGCTSKPFCQHSQDFFGGSYWMLRAIAVFSWHLDVDTMQRVSKFGNMVLQDSFDKACLCLQQPVSAGANTCSCCEPPEPLACWFAVRQQSVTASKSSSGCKGSCRVSLKVAEQCCMLHT